MITCTKTTSFSDGGSVSVRGSVQDVGATELKYDQTLVAGTNVSIGSPSITVANIQQLYILSSQNATLKTNSSGSPANTINLIAGIPLAWSISEGYFANPFTTNITQFFVTNAVTARLQYVFLTNP